jgi:hypothetical protein
VATGKEVDMNDEDHGIRRGVLDDCPRCRRPLTEDGQLRYCDGCAYEPPESAILPVFPPRFEDGDAAEPGATSYVMTKGAA